MKVRISGFEFDYFPRHAAQDELFGSVCRLAEDVFGLNLGRWAGAGYRDERYLPYILAQGGEVIANVSVNRMSFDFCGKRREYIQLGTVMTHPDFRNLGLSSFLMENVLADWAGKCDALYLFSNDGARDFYRRRGFFAAGENQVYITNQMQPRKARIRKLDMASPEDVALLLAQYKKGNPFSCFSMEENPGLLLFYCIAPLRDSLYYCKDTDAVVLAEYGDGHMFCVDIFGGGGHTLHEVLAPLVPPGTYSIAFGFTPKAAPDQRYAPLQQEDTTLLLYRGSENLFGENILMFPFISHA